MLQNEGNFFLSLCNNTSDNSLKYNGDNRDKTEQKLLQNALKFT